MNESMKEQAHVIIRELYSSSKALKSILENVGEELISDLEVFEIAHEEGIVDSSLYLLVRRLEVLYRTRIHIFAQLKKTFEEETKVTKEYLEMTAY